MVEAFQPIAVRPQSENRWLFGVRCVVDLQLLTIFRFLRCPLGACRGRVLDVGAGESPWKDLLPASVNYVGVDADSSGEFGMRRKSDVIYYDGEKLPVDDDSFDHVLCTEVLEHVSDPAVFLTELKRVLRRGGTLILTVPWAARLHHLPHDYYRFTRFGLAAALVNAGFSSLSIEERGSDVAVIANKLVVLTMRLLRPPQWRNGVWSWPLAVLLAPVTAGFLGAAHIALLFKLGSKEDPLGYGAIATKV